MSRALLLAVLLGACTQPPPVAVRAVVEQSDDETLSWVSELHGLGSLNGRSVDLDLTLPAAGPDGRGSGVTQAGAEVRCSRPGPLPDTEGDYVVTVPAVARVDLVLGEDARLVCTPRDGALAIRFRGLYRARVDGAHETPRVMLRPVD